MDLLNALRTTKRNMTVKRVFSSRGSVEHRYSFIYNGVDYIAVHTKVGSSGTIFTSTIPRDKVDEVIEWLTKPLISEELDALRVAMALSSKVTTVENTAVRFSCGKHYLYYMEGVGMETNVKADELDALIEYLR